VEKPGPGWSGSSRSGVSHSPVADLVTPIYGPPTRSQTATMPPPQSFSYTLHQLISWFLARPLPEAPIAGPPWTESLSVFPVGGINSPCRHKQYPCSGDNLSELITSMISRQNAQVLNCASSKCYSATFLISILGRLIPTQACILLLHCLSSIYATEARSFPVSWVLPFGPCFPLTRTLARCLLLLLLLTQSFRHSFGMPYVLS
jgi:hypothetical protein